MDPHLTETERRILLMLREADGKSVTYGELLERAWGIDYVDDQTKHMVSVNVGRLRKKLDPQSLEIVTDAGRGYRLVVG